MKCMNTYSMNTLSTFVLSVDRRRSHVERCRHAPKDNVHTRTLTSQRALEKKKKQWAELGWLKLADTILAGMLAWAGWAEAGWAA